MTQHDVSQWPLVVSIIDSNTLTEDLREVAGRWRDWLSWNEPFAALQIFNACDEGMLVERDRVLGWWLDAQRRQIRRNVVALASVIPGAHYEKMPHMGTHEFFGIPDHVVIRLPLPECLADAVQNTIRAISRKRFPRL